MTGATTRLTSRLHPRLRGAALGAALLAGVAGCGEDLRTGPQQFPATLALRNWSDTLVVGDQRSVAVRVLDAQGREVLGASVRWSVATPTVLGARLNAAGSASGPGSGGSASSGPTFDAVSATDSVQMAGQRPGTSDVVITLTDPRFIPTSLPVKATVVVAGVRAASARDTTLTALGDTSIVRGTALGRPGAGGAALAPIAGQGVTWARLGAGAVTLVGQGDSVRAVAVAPGTDTLVASHRYCLQGGHCADTVVVHVAQSARFAQSATAYRAWSLGDSVTPQVVVQDARGNAIAGATLSVAPLTAADSAIVGVNSTGGVPRYSRGMAPANAAAPNPAAPNVSVPTAGTSAVTARSVTRPLVMVVNGSHAARLAAAAGATATIAPVAAPLTAPPLVAQANGTARVAIRALAADGTLLGADTVQVIVRQIARVVHVAPTEADLTPGDSIPVQITAQDARGHRIADATFQPAMAGATYRDGRIVVPANATPGLATLQASVTGPAQPRNNPAAPVQDPAPDSSRVTVRVPAPVTAGDTSSAAANTLSVPVFGPDKQPLVGVWVRFLVPGGTLGADSVQTDARGIARTRWTLPTHVGTYTASAILLGGATATAAGDSAGRIVIRHTTTVQAGPAAALVLAAAPAPTATLGAVLPVAPVVQVTDQYGNPIALAGTPVTVAAQPAAGATLGGTLTVPTDSTGQARFANLVVTGAPGARTLAFTVAAPAGVASMTAGPITFTAGAVSAGQTTVVLSAPTVASGSTITVTVTPKDANGNHTGIGRTVTIAVSDTTNAASSTVRVTTVTDRGDGTYTATLTGVRAGTAVPVRASIDGAAATAAPPALQVTPGAPARLTVSPATLAFGTLNGTGTLTASAATDAAGNAVPMAGLTWTSSAPTIASVAAPSSPASSAIVTALAPGGAIITAQLGNVSATAAVSVQQHGANLVRVAGGTTAVVATAVGVQPSVRVVDAAGAGVAGVPVTFTVTGNPASVAGNTVGGNTSQTVTSASDGSATATAWTLGSVAGAYTLTAQAPGVTPVSFAATAVPGAVSSAHTTVALAATTVASGANVTATVTLADAYGNPLPGSHTVSAAYGSATPAAGVSTGTIASVADHGNSTYTVAITGVRAGTAAPVTATVDGVTVPASPPTLTVTPGAPSAATSALAVSASQLASGQTATVSVAVKDAAGNSVSAAAPGDVALAASVGSLGTVNCANGTCSAVYTAAGAGSASITATIGGTAVRNSPAAISVSSSLVVTRALAARSLTAGTAAASFTPVTASGGQAPYTFAISAGTLPSGLTLTPGTGAIAGTAAAARAATSLTVTVTDAAGSTASQSFALTVNPALATVQAVPSTTLTVGTAAAFTPVTVSGGTAPIGFALTGGTLPSGVTFDAGTGAVSGTAAASVAPTTFTVTATDAAGASSAKTFDLRVNGAPSAPSIGAISAGNGQLTAAFTAPASDGGSAITNYEYSTDNGATWVARTPAATTSPLVVTGLTNGTAYQLRLRAVNAVGSGTPSAATSGTPSTTPTAPTISSVTAAPSQLSVAFAAPSSNGGSAITNYQYSTDGGATWATPSPAATASPLVIAGLVNGTTYQVTLRAVNAIGAGAASAPATGTPMGTPAAPIGLVATAGNASAALSWTAPANTGGSAITDYAVRYSGNGGATWTTYAHAPSTATSATVPGLINGTTYQFDVAATSAAGTGAWSAPASATPGAPDAPTALAISFNQTSSTAEDGTLTWTAPANTGSSAITDYVVEYKPATATTWSTYTHTASTSTTATLTGFAIATTYNFRVTATNSSGAGTPSVVLVSITTGPSSRLSCTTPGSSNSSANSISIAPCGGVQVGNVIMVPLSIGNTSGTNNPITAESGFQVLGTQLSGAIQTTILYKVATAADVGRATPYSFGWSGNVKSVVTLVTYKGIDPAHIDFLSATATGATATSPTATVSDASAYTLAYIFTPAVPLSSTTPSLGEWTVSSGIWKNTTAGSNNNNAIAVLTSDVDKSATGTTAAQTARTSGMTASTSWTAAVLVLRPTP